MLVSVRICFQRLAFRLFPELFDLPVGTHFQQPQRTGQVFALGNDAHADVGAAAPVAFQQTLVVHAIELVAGKNQLIVVVAARETVEMLAHGVGRSLKPSRALHRLFGGKHFNVSAVERIKAIAVGDVPVQRRGIELRQNEDSLQARVEAVADGNIDQAILSSRVERQVWSGPESAETGVCLHRLQE